jgi:2-polyprenyl-3-methyl-5-hydroxy-6-metoxy-1,4-benzoquinol methylase
MPACSIRGCGGDCATVYRLARFDIVRCRSCGLLARHPLPDAEELRAMYEDPAYHDSTYFRGELAGDARADSPEVRLQDRTLAELAAMVGPSADGLRLLDVGCGTGSFVARARGAGWQAEGVELSANLARIAAENFDLSVHQGDFLEVDLAEDAFDIVTMWDFLEHVLDPVVGERYRQLLLARRRDGSPQLP